MLGREVDDPAEKQRGPDRVVGGLAACACGRIGFDQFATGTEPTCEDGLQDKAQYAPDEFALILPEANRQAIEGTLRRILHQARLGGLNDERRPGRTASCAPDPECDTAHGHQHTRSRTCHPSPHVATVAE